MVGGRWDRDVANIFPVKEALEREDVPYAVVTPDGEWHERGEMGWFGCASNEKELDVWKEIVLKLYSENMNCKIVLCDLHI